MKTFDVPIWVTITAENSEIAWMMVSDIVNMALSDAQELGTIVQWESGEPHQESEATA